MVTSSCEYCEQEFSAPTQMAAYLQKIEHAKDDHERVCSDCPHLAYLEHSAVGEPGTGQGFKCRKCKCLRYI